MVNDFIEILRYSSVNVFICIVLFHTNVIYEYFKYSKFISKILRITDYIQYQELTGDKDILYISYLATIYNNFFIKLITCPLCLGFWINLILSIISGDIFNIFIYYVTSVTIYSLFKLIYGNNN
jgi:hypothetical protein